MPRNWLSAKRSAPKSKRDGYRRAACAVRRLGGQLGRDALGIGAVGDDRPGHDDMMRGRSRPFEIGDRDLAMDAVGDRLQHAVIRQRGGIAVALDVEFGRRHGKRDVDGQHEFDVDRLGGAKRVRRGLRRRLPQASSCWQGGALTGLCASRAASAAHNRVSPQDLARRTLRPASAPRLEVLRIVERLVADACDLHRVALAEIFDLEQRCPSPPFRAADRPA